MSEINQVFRAWTEAMLSTSNEKTMTHSEEGKECKKNHQDNCEQDYCSTHNVEFCVVHCGNTIFDASPKNSDWRERFKDEFHWGLYDGPQDDPDWATERVENFITQELQLERKRVLEEVLKDLKKVPTGFGILGAQDVVEIKLQDLS